MFLKSVTMEFYSFFTQYKVDRHWLSILLDNFLQIRKK